MRNQLTKLYNIVSAPVTAIRDALAERLHSIRETASLLYNMMVENMGYGQKRLKNVVENEAEDKQQEDVDLTPHEHERVLKGAYRSFLMPGLPKTDIDSYFNQAKPHIKTLIKNQLKEMGFANGIRVKMPFNNLMKEFFEANDINCLIQRMLGYSKAQTGNPKFPESGFTLDKITHLSISFHKLVLTQGNCYTELPERIKK